MNDSIKLRVENLCKKYGNRTVLDNLSLDVHSGECLGVFGESGAGKSVLLKILAGMESTDSGTVSKKNGRGNLLLNPSGYYPHLTVFEVMWLYVVLFDIPRIKRRAAIRELLSLVVLEQDYDISISTLSDGALRRLDLAISLLSPAYILFLDEPASGLSRQVREQVWSYLRMILNRDQKTIVFTSSDPDDMKFCDRIVMLDYDSAVKTIAQPDADMISREVTVSADPLETAGFSLIIPGQQVIEIRTDHILRWLSV